ncbi:MAG: proteasome endopeptidase complex, archaeal, beta subunit [Thermofilum sp. ex4484_15]|nr:MAG: proteasome endopeptidase complex, archaeal, beta subunit [Thermofilum sp. ex4484_15]
MELNFKGVNRYLTGTTTVGLKCRDGIILATDRRVTSGYFIAHKKGRKIDVIDERIAVTIAGAVADAQRLVDRLKAEARLYRIANGKPMSVRSVASLASLLLFNVRPNLLLVHIIVGGVDEGGAALYNVDWFGTLTEEKYIATGSGFQLAMGVIESMFREDMNVKEALPIAVKAVRAAMMLDPGSGEGIDVVTVTEEGVKNLTDEEVRKILYG